jgi:type I restriction enzyme, R subunit
MNKKDLSERDICSQFINPALESAGWKFATQVREEVTFTKGRVMVRGKVAKRGEPKRADYILYYKPNIPIAVIEAKDNHQEVSAGMQQGLEYGRILDLPFVFASNGDGFVEHDRTKTEGILERDLSLAEFPSPEELWLRYCAWKGIEEVQRPIIEQDYFSDGTSNPPRYFQLIAVRRTIEAIIKGQNRILLVMATGTGKTMTTFHIIWRLWKAGVKKRILFLADRNILVDQARTNDFKAFGSAMTKITDRHADKSYEIYLSLYQAVTGTEEEQNIYKQFKPDFFDLIVIDECHRGSAAEDSAWRTILDYFSGATHIGLTATPKETKEVSNIHYFGEPLYTYSLKQGIDDGFLAPYKVVRIDLDKDLQGWRPEKGKRDKNGQLIEDRVYNQRDFDRDMIMEKRTEMVAAKITEFLKATDRFAKSIIFCEDIPHAERMRKALVNQNGDLVAENDKYVMRITGDNAQGKAELDNFILPNKRYPVLVTTSQLMSTGVDAQTCKLIVLDKRIGSMTEFKQIIGRGTRINEDYDKLWFTIMDFKKATEKFADKDFDGDPVMIYEPEGDDPPVPPDDFDDGNGNTGDDDLSDDNGGDDILVDPPVLPPIVDPPQAGRVRYLVGDVPFSVLCERTQYYGNDGKLITESMKDYSRRTICADYATLDDFLTRWSEAKQKLSVVDALERRGVLMEALAAEVGKDLDPFDLVCHVAYGRPPLTRKERAEQVKKRDYFTKFEGIAREVLASLLDKYADSGLTVLEDLQVLKNDPLTSYGTPVEIVTLFGGKDKFIAALRGLECELYKAA